MENEAAPALDDDQDYVNNDSSSDNDSLSDIPAPLISPRRRHPPRRVQSESVEPEVQVVQDQSCLSPIYHSPRPSAHRSDTNVRRDEFINVLSPAASVPHGEASVRPLSPGAVFQKEADSQPASTASELQRDAGVREGTPIGQDDGNVAKSPSINALVAGERRRGSTGDLRASTGAEATGPLMNARPVELEGNERESSPCDRTQGLDCVPLAWEEE